MGKFNGLRMRDERTMQGMNQREFAKRMGVSHQSVQQWESGKTIPTPENIKKMHDILSHNSAGRDINFFTPQTDADVKLDRVAEMILSSKTLNADVKVEVLTMIAEVKHGDNEE